jgi:iron complex outermembrane recepter protein
LRYLAALCLLGLLLPRPTHAQATSTGSPQGTVSTPTTDQSVPPASPSQGSEATELPQVTVIGATPLLGSGMEQAKVPAQSQVFNSKDISLTGPPQALQTLQTQSQGVNLNSAAGNPFQPDVFYHGFEASALQGTPNGIAVYVNGARFNNPFGDTVDWSLIPDIAIERMNLEGANPVFGLNALGGSLAVQMKDGFTYHGGELDVFGGSFGQISGESEYGRQIGNTAIYMAASGLHENGWRDFQQSGLKQFYGDIGWRTERAEVHLNVDAAQTSLNGPGTVPVELLQADPSAQFTGPNEISDNYVRVNLNGSFDVTDTTSIQAVAYYDNLLERVLNGNGSPISPCPDGTPFLCESPGVVATTLAGTPIPTFLGTEGVYGSVAAQTTNTNGYGAAAQVTNRNPVFGHPNVFVAGFSFDGAQTTFSADTQVSGLDVLSRNAVPPFEVIDLADGSIAPVRAGITNAYYGAYLTDTLDITPRLSSTVSGRFNAEEININDLNGTEPGLTGNHYYSHLNPGVGLTFKITPRISLYGGYSTSNRAPTPAELTCSNPSAPCSLANFFTGDPNLKQPVAHTIELGVRGQFVPYDHARVTWNLSAYRTNLDDDIIFAQSVILGTGFFQNVGSTRRQGFDMGARLTTPRWTAWVNYSYINATFQSTFVESSPNNPAANADGNIVVVPGDQLPGIPSNIVNFGVQYNVTDKWTVGTTAVATTGQYLFGDEANLTKRLPGYFLLNLNTHYQVTPKVQLFALVQNAFNQTYYTYGTFSPTTSVPIVQVPGATNTRSYNIGAPIAAYGGLKVLF